MSPTKNTPKPNGAMDISEALPAAIRAFSQRTIDYEFEDALQNARTILNSVSSLESLQPDKLTCVEKTAKDIPKKRRKRYQWY